MHLKHTKLGLPLSLNENHKRSVFPGAAHVAGAQKTAVTVAIILSSYYVPGSGLGTRLTSPSEVFNNSMR